MENATKALLITAGVLVGVMILSLGTYLYYSLSTYVSESKETINENALTAFNTQFLQYNNAKADTNGNIKIDFKLRIQDIITVANIAYENNLKYNLKSEDANEKTYYVRVNAKINGITQVNNLEQMVNTKASEWLSNDNGYEYTCINTDIKLSTETGRVYEINFK